MINTALAAWRAGGPSLGVWMGLGDLRSAEILAGAGFDWLCVDLQHGFMDAADLAKILAVTAASPTTPLVRVLGNQPDQIGKALDAGALGVILPMVGTADEAARAAAACRYAPRGGRSRGPVRGALAGVDPAGAGDEIACVAMIETAEGVANVDAIAATPGVDALFVGPVDLCLSLGLRPTDFGSERFTAAISAVLGACVESGKPAGIFGYSTDLASSYLESGFAFTSIGDDGGFIARGAATALAAMAKS